MTRTGVLSLIIAAFAVTNTSQVYAQDSASYSHSELRGRNLNSLGIEPSVKPAWSSQISASASAPSVNLARLEIAQEQIFAQFMDYRYQRLEGHITTDKLYYRATDAVFVDLVVNDAQSKRPFSYIQGSTPQTVTIKLVGPSSDNVIHTLTQSILNPALGFSFKLSSTIQAGVYKVVASSDNMAPAVRSIRVLSLPSTTTPTTTPNKYEHDLQFFQTYAATLVDDVAVPVDLSGKFQLLNGATMSPIASKPQVIATVVQVGLIDDDDDEETEMVAGDVVIDSLGSSIYYLDQEGSIYFQFSNYKDLYDVDNNPRVIIQVVMSTSETLTYTQAIGTDDLLNTPAEFDTTTVTTSLSSRAFDDVSCQFNTESQADLVQNVNQKVYFYTYISTPSGTTVPDFKSKQDFLNIVGGSVKSYNSNNVDAGISVVATNVSSVFNGFGQFSFVYNSSLTYFLEFTIADWTPTIPSSSALPSTSISLLKGGIVRCPVSVRGLQTRAKEVEKRQYLKKNPNLFAVENLVNFQFTDTTEFGSNTYTIKYERGFYTVTRDDLPPILVYNRFPNPLNFFNALNYLQPSVTGILNDVVQDATIVSDAAITLNSEVIAKAFVLSVQTVIQNTLAYNPEGADTIAQIGLANISSPSYDIDDLKADISRLQTLFDQIPGEPQHDVQYFGKYGPLAQQEYDSIDTTIDSTLQTSKVLKASVRLSIAKRTIANNEALVLNIATNELVNPEHAYVLQVKQKENIVYQTQMSFATKQSAIKVTVPAASIPFVNGGIFQVNLYRVTDDFIQFQTITNSTSLCNTTIIETIYGALNATEKAGITAVNSILKDQMTIAQAIQNSNIVNTQTKCVLITPDLAARFLVVEGIISFFKKPNTTYTINLTTNKQVYLQGEQVTLDMTLIDVATKKVVTTGTHAASVFVSEDRNLGMNTQNQGSLGGKVFLEGEVDYNRYQFLNPLSQIDQLYGLASSSNEATLDILLAAHSIRQLVYEALPYGLFANQYQYMPEDLTNALPNSLEDYSRQFGYNFHRTSVATPFTFTASGIQNFIAPPQSYSGDNIANPPSTYFRSLSPLDAYASVTSTSVNEQKLSLPDGYKRSNNVYQAETLYYGNNIKFTNGKAQIKFFTSDLAGSFKIRANSYSSTGFGSGQGVISTGSAFDVSFELPPRMLVGDKINITATISNANAQVMTVTPSLIGGLEFAAADFTYYLRTLNSAGKYQVTPQTTYTVAANTTNTQVVFVLTALQYAEFETLTFRFIGELSDGNTFNKTYTPQINIVDSGIYSYTTQSGQIGTRAKGSTIPSIAEIPVTFPAASNLESIIGLINIYPNNLAYYSNIVRGFLESNPANERNCDDVIFKLINIIKYISQIESKITALTGVVGRDQQVAALSSKRSEAILRITGYVNALAAFQIIDGTSYKGYDYYKLTTQSEGSMTLTSLVLKTLREASNYVEYSITDKSGAFQKNLVWLMGRLVDGSFAQTSDDVDVLSAVPQNITDLYIYSNLVGLEKNEVSVNTELQAVLDNLITFYDGGYLGRTQTPLTSDPIFLSLSIIALSVSDVDYESQITTIASRLLSHISNGRVSIPALISNFVYTPFNSVKVARENELHGLAAIAMYFAAQINTDLLPTYRAIIGQIKNRGTVSGYGSRSATYFSMLAMGFDVTNTLYLNSRCQISLSFNGTVLSTLAYQGDMSVLSFPIGPSMMYEAGVTKKFTLAVLKDTAYDEDMDIVFGYQSIVQFIDDSYVGLTASLADLSLTVTNLNSSSSLGRAKSGSTFVFNVTLLNPNRVRNQGLTHLVVRPPSCLSFDATQLAKYTGPGSLIQSFESYPDSHEYLIELRGLNAGQNVKIPLIFKQVSIGSCVNRKFSAYYVNSFRSTIVTASPRL
eukprot:403333158